VVIILVIVLIIFGAGKLPHVMGDVAKGIKNFKAGMADENEGEDGKKSIEGDDAAAKPDSATTAQSSKAKADDKQT
jgi:sec-independent protein translocase protein TatA